MQSWDIIAQTADTGIRKHERHVFYPAPLAYPSGGLGLSSGLWQHGDDDLWAHLSYLADCSEKVVLEASCGERRNLYHDEVSL